MDEASYWREKILGAPPLRPHTFRNVRVTFRMGSPVCVTTPWISFDGLISHAMLLDALGEDYFILPKKLPLGDILVHRDDQRRVVPIKHTGGVYHSSVSIFTPYTLKTTTMYKRFYEAASESLGRKKIRVGSGCYRSYMMRTVYIPAHTVTFYACCDPALVKRLLEEYIFSLGNDTRVGYGVVNSVEIEEVDDDISLVYNGRAMRPIPVSLCKQYEMAVPLPYRAPYWDPSNITLCVPPGERCELADNTC